ncbi:MAG: hypothetical protein KC496_04175 [Anaerolineae bacterium]|nr:hypothetical protein [Anaerolineae bacterium]
MKSRKMHHRRTIRLEHHDYAEDGVYFVTICSHLREWMFGEIVDDVMQLNTYGEIVIDEWQRTGDRKFVELDAFVVMPNHVHGIIVINHSYQATASGVGAQDNPSSPPNVEAQDNHTIRPNVGAQNRPIALPNVGAQDNHVMSDAVGAQRAAPLHVSKHKPGGITPNNGAPGSLGAIVRAFKSAVTRRINLTRNTPGAPVWQRNYWERVVRDEKEWNWIRQYIATNPAKWAEDTLYTSAE